MQKNIIKNIFIIGFLFLITSVVSWNDLQKYKSANQPETLNDADDIKNTYERYYQWQKYSFVTPFTTNLNNEYSKYTKDYKVTKEGEYLDRGCHNTHDIRWASSLLRIKFYEIVCI